MAFGILCNIPSPNSKRLMKEIEKFKKAIRHGKLFSRLTFGLEQLEQLADEYCPEFPHGTSLLHIDYNNVDSDAYNLDLWEEGLLKYHEAFLSPLAPAYPPFKKYWFHTEDPRNWGDEGRFHNPDNKLFSK